MQKVEGKNSKKKKMKKQLAQFGRTLAVVNVRKSATLKEFFREYEREK